ncbi:unnamed protein product [Cuscuta europaea]|uniref:Uncharacterized protein n=1 Tax=Cuscuta europaea TaxID=41803 RepID=A0A9P0ZFM6_CUSEU|nr:unnamed protein product [Cuscuta europaea]
MCSVFALALCRYQINCLIFIFEKKLPRNRSVPESIDRSSAPAFRVHPPIHQFTNSPVQRQKSSPISIFIASPAEGWSAICVCALCFECCRLADLQNLNAMVREEH